MGISSRARRTVTAFACALALSGAAFAHAAGSGLIEVSKPIQLDAGKSGFVEAVCPKGKAALPGFETQVTGGALIVPEVDNVFSSRRVALTAENVGNAPGTATAFAYCSNLSPSQVISDSSTTPLSPQETSTATATCPEGSSAIAGAFNLKPDTPTVRIFKSVKVGRDRWRIEATNTAVNAEVDLEAQVICQQRKGKLVTHKSKLEQGPTTASATAICANKELLISGGYSSTAIAATPVFVNTSRRDGKRTWLASAFAETGDASIRTFAYCAPK